jgi:hypothetical protein
MVPEPSHFAKLIVLDRRRPPPTQANKCAENANGYLAQIVSIERVLPRFAQVACNLLPTHMR